MIEIESEGTWPSNSVADINNACIRLENEGVIGKEGTLLGSFHLMKCLDAPLPGESESIRSFLLKNKFVEKIVIEGGFNGSSVVLLWYRVNFTDDLDVELEKVRVKINNVKLESPLDFYVKKFNEHIERIDKLTDALQRLVDHTKKRLKTEDNERKEVKE